MHKIKQIHWGTELSLSKLKTELTSNMNERHANSFFKIQKEEN